MKRADMQPGVLYAIRSASWGGTRPGWITDTAMGWKRTERTRGNDNDGLPLPRREAGGTMVCVEVLGDLHVHDRDEDGVRLRGLLEEDRRFITAVPTNWVLGTWHDYSNGRYASIRQRQLDHEAKVRADEEQRAALFAEAIRFAPIIEAAVPNQYHAGVQGPAFARQYVSSPHGHGFFSNKELVRLFEWLVQRDPTLLTELPSLDIVTLDGEPAQVGKPHWPTCVVATLDGRHTAEYAWGTAHQILNKGGNFTTRDRLRELRTA